MFYQKKIVIAGGSGFIGQAMAERWAADNEVVILTRGLNAGNNAYGSRQFANVQYVEWDARSTGSWTSVIKGADVLINLCGKSVNCRYTTGNRQAILTSRIQSTRALGAAIRQCTKPPKLWINAGSATIYRHATDRPQDEATGEMHNDFSVQVCKAWEAAFNAQSTPYTRKVVLRTAIVLGDGGVLVPFKRLVLTGLGGHQGDGRQMFSWIHIEDLCRMVAWIADHPEEEGIYNASAPGPVSNRAFMQELRKVLGVSFGLPAPACLLRIGAWIIGTETELLLKSRWVLPARLLREGFEFLYPDIQKAMKNLLIDEPVIESHSHAMR
jgi:uncharacterized protein (TIGR01777 family)